VISFCLGLLTFIAIPAIAPSLSLSVQRRIGDWCYKSCLRAYGQAAVAWRELGGAELKPLNVNDEESLARVVLSSGTLGDDKELPFKDFDDRVGRLYGKSIAIVPERVPLAVDAEIAEVGHWLDERDGRATDEHSADPFVPVGDGLRAANPLDALTVAAKGVSPLNIDSAREMTEARFDRYGSGVGAVETAATIMSFAVGAGVAAGLVYLREQVLGGAGGPPGGTVTIPGAVDLATQVVGVMV
jgi:hypothetical protein